MNQESSLSASYLLVVFSLPAYVDQYGRRYLDPLWLKDLVEHARYLPRLSLACPRVSGVAPPIHYIPVDSAVELDSVTWIDLPRPSSTWQALRYLPKTMGRLWHALKYAEVVHSSVVSWPIPSAWLLLPLLRFRPRPHIIVVESATWRLLPGTKSGLAKQGKARIWEFMARYCLRRCDLAIYTQQDYRRSLHKGSPERGYVIPASWIDDSRIATSIQALQSWEEKSRSPKLRLLFAGRLVPAKGVQVLLEGIIALAGSGKAIQLTIIGDGPLRSDCEAAAARIKVGSEIRILGGLSYGEEFFSEIRRSHLLLVPSLSDEQPRIIFDAWSQGVPVIASRTPGLVDHINSGVTNGWLFEVGNSKSLCETISYAAMHQEELRRIGLSALVTVQSFTHREMHRKRLELILKMFPNLSQQQNAIGFN